jgi:hypothetical protein
MTPEEWIESQYEYSGVKTDFIQMKKLYEDYCKETSSNIKYRDFRYKIMKVKFNSLKVYYLDKKILGKVYYSVMIKIVPKKI